MWYRPEALEKYSVLSTKNNGDQKGKDMVGAEDIFQRFFCSVIASLEAIGGNRPVNLSRFALYQSS